MIASQLTQQNILSTYAHSYLLELSTIITDVLLGIPGSTAYFAGTGTNISSWNVSFSSTISSTVSGISTVVLLTPAGKVALIGVEV